MQKELFKQISKWGLNKALFMLFLFIFTNSAMASHFRHGTISWRVINNNTIEFKISQAWANGGNWTVGQTGYSDVLYFGDGQSTGFSVVATAVNSSENWYYGETTITHTYANTGNFLAYFSSCCKISQLSNNANAYWRNETLVNVGSGNESPVTTMAPIINMQTGTNNATFQVPASDPDGDNLTYRLANYNEFSGNQPSGISIDPNTGLITFNTSGRNVNSLWNAAIVVEDGSTKVINDFIIKIVQQSNPPIFDYTVTPANATVLQVSPGDPINFSVKAFDNDPGATVSLQSIGVPPGATVTLSNQNTSTITGNFSWTPTTNNLGTNVINFLAQDNVGAQVSTSVSIIVSLKPLFNVPPTPAQGVHNIYNPGDVITYTVQASDPDPLDVVQITDVKGKDSNNNPIPLYSNASFSNINGVAANPVSGTFTWNTQASDWGHKHVYFYATDSYGDVTKHEINQLINTPPVFTSTPNTTADVGTPYSYTIQVTDADIPYGDAISFSSGNLPSWLTITDNGNGTATLSGTPTTTDAGTVSIAIQAEDINHHQDPRGIINQQFDLVVNNCVVSAIVKDITIELDANGTASIVSNDINNGSIATCGEDTLTIDQTTFNATHLGTNNVTLTITDINNNSSSAVAVVTLVDVISPILSSNDITVALDEFGNTSISIDMIDNGSTDNSGNFQLSLDIDSFDCSQLGENTVTLSATDGSGNTASVSTTVTVVDIIAPIIQTQDYTISLVNGEATITADDINNNTTDNCNFTLNIDESNFDCSDIGEHTITLTATDESGNTSSETAVVTVIGAIPSISISDFTAVNTQQGNTIFLGYGPQSVNLSTTVGGGNSFTYQWTASTGEIVDNIANPTISPIVSTIYSVTTTNNYGCTATTELEVCVIDARTFDKKGNQTNKVLVCHATSGKKGTKHVLISISSNAVANHLSEHGDRLGDCDAACVTSSSTTTTSAPNYTLLQNPTNGTFNVKIKEITSETTLTLYNLQGEVVDQTTVSSNYKSNVISVGKSSLPSGSYVLHITSSEISASESVMVK